MDIEIDLEDGVYDPHVHYNERYNSWYSSLTGEWLDDPDPRIDELRPERPRLFRVVWDKKKPWVGRKFRQSL